MKYLVIAMLSLAFTSVAMADGYKCIGDDGYRAKVFNKVNPKDGTKNPAVLIVSHEERGTVASLEAGEINAEYTKYTMSYDGQTNGEGVDGRFVYVKLEIEKDAQKDGMLEGKYLAQLTVNADGASTKTDLVCSRYLKGDRK